MRVTRTASHLRKRTLVARHGIAIAIGATAAIL